MKNNTYFVDIDGTIFVYRKFETYKTSKAEVINSTKQFLQEKFEQGHCIVLTTARPENLREHTIQELEENNIPFNQIVMGEAQGTCLMIWIQMNQEKEQ